MGLLSGLTGNLNQITKLVSSGNTGAQGVAGQLSAQFQSAQNTPLVNLPENAVAQAKSLGLSASFQDAITTPLKPNPLGLSDQFQSAGSTALTSNSLSNNSLSDLVSNPTINTDEQEITVTAGKKDQRVRLQALPRQENQVYGEAGNDNILSILHDTNGLLFPFTPSISFSQTVDYEASGRLVHTNFETISFARSNTVELSVTGKFTVQNQREGIYMLAVLHFLRVASKMYFGAEDAKDGKAGIPPPVLQFSGYGTYMFNRVRCVLKSHSYSFEEGVDKVRVQTTSGTTWLPSLLSVSMTLGVVQSPVAQRDDFSLAKFRTGDLLIGGGWI